ncbi:MAG: hypothetical protein H7Y42_15780 [Chitinophagaceae bacterium]|nr:hypothetical protein [Chitinophagaceae bacterium]
MKAIFLLWLFSFSLMARSQGDRVYQSYVDLAVRSLETSSPAILVREITSAQQTDREKVTSIFRWITGNISYNVKAWNRGKRPIYEEPEDTARTLKPLNQRVAETVLKRRIAVCDGYARLFKTLCDHAGVPSEIIMGYARTGAGSKRDRFKSNHTWNAVYLDSSWHLLDATWASGFTTHRGDAFVQQYDHKYFLASPGEFIVDHYPEDMSWTLLKDPPSLVEFNHTPFKYTGFVKTLINSYSPSKGVIEASLGDSIRFEVESSSIYGLLSVASTPPVDTIWNDDEPAIIGGRKKTCVYNVTDPTVEWLYVTCNGRIILRYRLQIRKPENKMATIGIPD